MHIYISIFIWDLRDGKTLAFLQLQAPVADFSFWSTSWNRMQHATWWWRNSTSQIVGPRIDQLSCYWRSLPDIPLVTGRVTPWTGKIGKPSPYPWVFPAASGFQRLLHLAHLADCDTCEAARLTRSPIRSPTRAQWPQCWWAREISTNWRRRTMKTYERHMKNTWKTYERHKDVQSRKTTWIRDATLVKDFIPLQSGTGAFGHCSVMLLSRDAYRKCLVKPGGRFF